MHDFSPNSDRLVGDLDLQASNAYMISTKINDAPDDFIFQLDPGTTYSQIDMDTAELLKLRGKAELFGTSTIADGSDKVDLICVATISLLGKATQVVLKVAPEQPLLLGCDVILALDLVPYFREKKFTISSGPSATDLKPYGFKMLKWGTLLKTRALLDEDLELVSPEMFNQALQNVLPKNKTGTANLSRGLDLGRSMAMGFKGFSRWKGIDLGRSN